MTVRLIHNDHDHAPVPLNITLNGTPFPPEDIQALWNMVTPAITVQWSTGTNSFVLQRDDGARRFGRTSLMPVVYGGKAFDYDTWVQAIAKLL